LSATAACSEICQIFCDWQQFSSPLIFGHYRRKSLISKAEKASPVAGKFFSPSEKVSSSPKTIVLSVEQVVSAVEKTVSAPEKSVSGVEQSVPAVEKVVLALGTTVSGVEKSVSGDGEIVFLLEKMSFVKRIYV